MPTSLFLFYLSSSALTDLNPFYIFRIAVPLNDTKAVDRKLLFNHYKDISIELGL